MRPKTCYLLAIGTLLSATLGVAAPAAARVGDTVADARELARQHGAKAVRLFTARADLGGEQARVVQTTWVAPDEGWTLEQANGFLKLLVGGRRRIMVKTSRAEAGYVYSFRYQDEVAARCVYEQNRVREITATAPAFVEADAVETQSQFFLE